MPREMIKYCVRGNYVTSHYSVKKYPPLPCSLTKSKLIKTILPGIHNFYKGKNDIYPGENYIWESAFGSWNLGIILISLLGRDDSESLQLPFDCRAFISLSS